MEAKDTSALKFLVFFSTYFLIWENNVAVTLLIDFDSSSILDTVQNSCVLLLNTDSINQYRSLFTKFADQVFVNEEQVVVGTASFDDFSWPTGESLVWANEDVLSVLDKPVVVLFTKLEVDRSCLYRPSHTIWKPRPKIYDGPYNIDTMIDYVNSHCQTYRTEHGYLNVAGLHREDILENLHSVKHVTNISVSKLYSQPNCVNPILNVGHIKYGKTATNSCDTQCTETENHEKDKYLFANKKQLTSMQKCERITEPITQNEFFDNYLKHSKPFVLDKSISNWPAFTKWTNEYLLSLYQDKNVHVKLTPGGDYEGVEKIEQWENHQTFYIPAEVKDKLPYPDLVVVRPAGVNMNFSQFIDIITTAAAQGKERNVSAYLEYSSLPNYMPELEADLEEFGFVKDLLQRRHLNIWLSDGHTLGRLHFDPFDNFLCQIRGKKQVILFEPSSSDKLYEAHIQQATLGYDSVNRHFRRKSLEDSTSMVMSPVDLLNPDFQRFPGFGDTYPLNCTLDEGDALFMPAFWWHEVYSWPNKQEHRNLAVNFWYEPFLKKEFPCPECKLDVNPYYTHLL